MYKFPAFPTEMVRSNSICSEKKKAEIFFGFSFCHYRSMLVRGLYVPHLHSVGSHFHSKAETRRLSES